MIVSGGYLNLINDIKEEVFREYRYDDYVSITCGYDWRDPTYKEIKNVRNLIKSIFPIQEERDLFLQILATGVDGRCLEKFVGFNGSGGNGKSVMNNFMLKAVEHYKLLANNSILFEDEKKGSNPEKANLDKKIYVVFR